MTRFFAVVWLALFALAAPAAAQTFPQLTGRVVDQANLLPPAQELELAAKSEALEAQTGRQLVIATVSSLEGRTIEDYGYRLGRHWQIGRKGEDDGVILLVAPKEKKVRVETGYGARVFLPDVVSGRIIREAILPRFREGDFAGGIQAGTDRIVTAMSLSPADAQRQAAEASRAEQSRAEGSSGLPVIFWAMIIGFVLLSMMRRAGGRRYRSHRRRRGGISPWVVLWGLNELSRGSRGGWGGGGGFGGGFGGGGGGFGGFSGGGGSFGGGGASGGW